MASKYFNLLIILAVFGLLWLADDVMRTQGPQSEMIEAPVIQPQEAPAPDFSFTTLDGQSHTLYSLAGKTVILNFWASWCIPCIEEFPRLLKIAQTHGGMVVLLAVSIDFDRADAERFIARVPDLKKRQNVLIAHDKDKSVSRDLFGTVRIPETIIIGPDGRMTAKIVGSAWTEEDLEKFLDNEDMP